MAIETAVGTSDVVLAVIGAHWLDVSTERGRRLDDPDDFVVLEIKAGLDPEIPVIPVLVGEVSVPCRDELPTALAALARRQSLRLDYDSFNADFARLATTLEHTFPRPVAHGAPAPTIGLSDDDIQPPSRLLGTLKGSNTFYSAAFSSDMQIIAGAAAARVAAGRGVAGTASGRARPARSTGSAGLVPGGGGQREHACQAT